MDFSQKTIKDIHDELVSGKITSQQLYEYCKKNIDAREHDIHAFVEVFDDVALPEVRQDFLLSGIPVAMKDNILFKGKGASASSKILEPYIGTYDSKIAEIFNTQGAVVVGRTNMDEFAMGSSTETSAFGITKNPIDTSRVPGGSSGGSAAAVASGMAFYALGSDTGGSIRQPAAFCGLVGLKPTYGSVSRRGLMALSSSLDVIGPLTRSVDDAKTVFQALSEYDELDSTCVPLDIRSRYQDKNTNNKIIGVPRAFIDMEGLDPQVKENFEAGLEAMKKQGYDIVDIDLPLIEHSLAVYYILQPAEASSNLARYDGVRFGLKETGSDVVDSYFTTRSKGFGKEVKRRIMLGTHVLSSGYHDEYYYKAIRLREAITAQIHNVFETVDIIATPTTANVAFPFGSKKDPVSMYLEDIFTVPYNLSGNPAIAIPSGVDSDGLPYSMHFVAPMFCEQKLFEVGSDFERAIL